MEQFDDLIGLTKAQADAWLTLNPTPGIEDGLPVEFVRVMRLDGKPLIGTRDYNVCRLNVSVENGVITSADRVG